MDFTNIKDPAGVKAFLESLRSSDIFSSTFPVAGPSNEATTSTQNEPVINLPVREPSPPPGLPPGLSSHISALLSRLGGGSGNDHTSNVHFPMQSDSYNDYEMPLDTPPEPPLPISKPPVSILKPTPFIPKPTPPAIPTPVDLRTLPFHQALSHIGRLLEDPKVLKAIKQIKSDQDAMEVRLWEGRQTLLEKQKEKVKKLEERTKIIGTTPTPREIEALQVEFDAELRRYDKDRVLSTWSEAVTRQQKALEALGVPSMFASSLTADRQRQQRVIEVLSNAIMETAGG